MSKPRYKCRCNGLGHNRGFSHIRHASKSDQARSSSCSKLGLIAIYFQKIVTTKAISDEECVERLSEYNATYLPENQLCTFNDENKGSCGGNCATECCDIFFLSDSSNLSMLISHVDIEPGESGGPLVYNNGIENVQVGVVSWGPCNGGKALPLKYPRCECISTQAG